MKKATIKLQVQLPEKDPDFCAGMMNLPLLG